MVQRLAGAGLGPAVERRQHGLRAEMRRAASMIGTPTFCGRRSGSPVTDIRPLSAWAAMS